MHLDRHYTDPRLTAIYDAENAGRADLDHYLAVADERGARRAVDLGCGTGILAAELAARGIEVVGVDPARAMLDVARNRPGGDQVLWVEGTADQLPEGWADLALMTGNVAQVFLDDDEWRKTLRRLHDALVPGGALAFEARDPHAVEWRSWTPEATYVHLEEEGVETWLEVLEEDERFVRFRGHNRFVGDDGKPGEDLVVDSELVFRTREELDADLQAAGFQVEACWGDWQRGPVTDHTRFFTYLAVRP